MTEKITLTNELEYRQVQAELNARKKPSKTLRFMMQALENYRQSKKMGWSRPWNKYQVINFQSFKLNAADLEIRQLALKTLAAEVPNMPDEAAAFVRELMDGSQAPMGFVFFQEFTDQDRLFEGVVASFGRINSENRRFRDRLDVILESEVIDGCSQGLTRMRIYVDPYQGNKPPLWQQTIDAPSHADSTHLFAYLANVSWLWATDKSRIWQHWVNDYIDYFGDRQWNLQKSYFYMNNPDGRITLAEPAPITNAIKAA
jgi:hypothetical protein